MMNSKSTRDIRNIVAILLVIAIFVQSFISPILGDVRVAYAISAEEGEVDEPSPIESPVTEVPEPTESPLPTEAPSESPAPPEETGSLDEIVEQYNYTIESLMDENGFLSDEGLLSLSPLPYDEEKYIDVEENKDGTKTLKLYNDPIKFENEKGEYQLIDNSIVATDLTIAKTHSEHEYTNKASDVEVLMADNLDQSSAIEMNVGNYSIGFKPLDILTDRDKSSAELSFISPDGIAAKDEVLDSDSNYSTIEYPEVFSKGIDLQITPTSTGVKEDIILNKLPEQKEFSYEFTAENVVPLLREDGNLYFADLKNGILVASVAAPVMYDSAEESAESYNIAVTLEVTGENTYKYTMIPDRVFLEDENRIYPVIIDPSINSTTSQIADSFITSRYTGNNYVNDVNLKIGYGDDLKISRGLIKINQFPSILAGNAITNVKYYAYQNYSGSSTPTIQVALITSSWDPATVKWSNKPTLGSVYAQKTVQATGWYDWDVTSLVNGWFTGTITNYGMYLMSSDEGSNKYKRFYSANNSSNQNYYAFTFKDMMGPREPISLSATNSFNGPTGSITLNWGEATDLPIGGASGIEHYRVAYRTSGAWTYSDRLPSTARLYTFTNLPDNTTYEFAVQAIDIDKNEGSWKSLIHKSPDKTGPVVPIANTIPNATVNWTNVTTPTIEWRDVTDVGKGLKKVQYAVDNPNGSWYDLGTTATGSKTIAISGDGIHTIYVRGVDNDGNYSVQNKTIIYKLDEARPGVTLDVLPSGNLKGIVKIKASVTNSGGSAFEEWNLEFGYGNPATTFGGPHAKITGNNTLNDEIICELDTTKLTQDVYLTLMLTASDQAGNVNTIDTVRFISRYSTQIDAALQIVNSNGYNGDGYQPDINDSDLHAIDEQETIIAYKKVEGGINGLSNGKLYANNRLVNANATNDEDGEHLVNVFNAAAYSNGWVYPEGSIVFLYTQAKDSSLGELFSTSTQQALEIIDTFDNTSKIDSDSVVNVQQVNGIMQLINTGMAGSFESNTETFAGDVSYIDLTVDQTTSGSSNIAYMVSVDGGDNWEDITPVSTDGGVTINLSNRKYYTTAVGERVKLRAIFNPNVGIPVLKSWSMDVRYTTYANALLVENTFPKDARGMTNLDKVTHNEVNESIELSALPAPSIGYWSTGSVQSTVRQTSNDVIEACLEVEENLPAGTDIAYYISTKAGAENSWTEITPGNAGVLEDWVDLSDPGKQVVIKAELSGNGTDTPELLSWRLSIKEKIGGLPYMVKLVDEPWNLSTLTGANYMTLLRWEASETQDVTYNVYRSTTPFFVPSAETLAAEGILENSWNDYNLNYGQKFYYKVTAVKMISGHLRESLPSNEAWATMVSEDEVTRRLGLQNYWSYAGFNTGSGTGYVNVSNGNIVYTTTDIVVSDPFLAAVMRRTFNSLANTKTAMGYGWDFSFNTCLMREYSGSTELGMILKDGDGSFHRFEKDGSVYKSAKGTFMELTYNAALDEYQIKRKDNIVYHFDAQSMKLKSFSDNNGNELLFRYDERGNLSEVENTVGDKVMLKYHVEGAAPEDPDYPYVNNHPDMLESVTWTEDTQTDPVSITYTYKYTDSDRLSRGYTTVEGNTTYAEEFNYDTSNRLVTITDPEEKETGFSYDTSARVGRITYANGDYHDYTFNLPTNPSKTTVTDQNGVEISYEYDGDGLVSKKTDALNHSISYTYNGDYLVTGMSYKAEVNGAEQTISYTYAYTNGNITSISGSNGAQTTYGTYNSFNKPASVSVKKNGSVTQTTSYTYDSHGNLLTTTDPEGKKTTNTYSTVNGDVGYLTQVEGDFGNQTRYMYDNKGRATEIKEYNNGTFVRTATTYAYDYDVDGYFMRVRATDAMSNSVSTYYDQLGRTVKVVYPDGKYELRDYDLASNVEKVRNRSGYEVDYSYDDLYRMVGASYPDNTTNSIQYLKWDSDGTGGNDADKVVKTDGTGTTKAIEYYDKAGRIVKTSVSNGVTEITTASYVYDAAGYCTQVTDNAGRVSKAEYNALGQTTKTIIDPNTENIQTLYTYDLLGNKLSVKDGAGYTTSYAYDNNSRLATVTQTVGSETYATSYAYDVEEGGYIKNRMTDAEGNVSEVWFDPMGRKIKDYNVGDTGDSTVMQTSYSYDNNFRVSIVTRNDETKEKYTYNNMGQTTRVDYYEASESTGSNSDDYIEYEYDANGNVTRESVYHGQIDQTTTYAYDSMDRVRQMTQGDLQNGGVSVNYTYDGADRVTEISYTKDQKLRKLGYVYDGYGRIQRITLALDSAEADTVREYVYKANGDLDHIKDYREFEDDGADYIKTVYTLNSAGQTKIVAYTDYEDGTGAGVEKEKYEMTYDGRGYIVSEKATTRYGVGEADIVNKTYTYDAIGRLTQATIDDTTKNYTYDKVGNRLTVNDGTDTMAYTYNQFNQLTGITKNNALQTSYTYDGRGNQTQEVQRYFGITKNGNTTYYNQTTDYSYDLMNNLAQADISTPQADGYGNVTYTNETSTNAYNASGQRVKRVENDETTNYYYSGSATLFTANANNWLLTENVLDPGGQIVASARFDDTNPVEIEGFYFYHYDMRGSTTAIVAPNGTLKTGYTYDEFGNIEQTGSQTFLNDVTFTGSVTDKSTGLQYMNSRFYNPSSGRFLSQDTYTGNPYEPWTQHLYSYSGNNPTSMVDPTGHFFNLIAAAVGAAVGAVVGVVGNGIANAINNKPFFENAGKAALIGAGVGALVGITCGAIAAAGGVSSALASAGAAIKTAAVTVGAAVKTAAAAVTTAAVTAGTYIASQGQRFIEGARNVVQRAGEVISNASTKVGQVVSNVVDKVKSIGNSSTSQNTQALQTYWPPNDGFAGTPEKIMLNIGDKIQRVGALTGYFSAPAGTPWQTLSLPYDKIGQAITQLRVVKPFEVLAGRAVPWFQSIGGGMQYLTNQSIQRLIDSGFLE